MNFGALYCWGSDFSTCAAARCYGIRYFVFLFELNSSRRRMHMLAFFHVSIRQTNAMISQIYIRIYTGSCFPIFFRCFCRWCAVHTHPKITVKTFLEHLCVSWNSCEIDTFIVWLEIWDRHVFPLSAAAKPSKTVMLLVLFFLSRIVL